MTGFADGARLLTCVVMGVLMAASGNSAALAGEVTPSSVNGVQHFFDCFGVMIHDGQAHQQYCSPSNNPAPGTESLGSHFGGACVTPRLTMNSPLFKPFDVASLGEDFELLPPKPAELLVARPGPVSPCCASLGAPLFATYQLASLDEAIGGGWEKFGKARMLVTYFDPCAPI